MTSCVGACHKTESQGSQLSIWQNSKHSQAYLTLQTTYADSIATAKGFTTAAAETPECLKCHSLVAADAGNVEDTFDKTEGVQCESCHGPGSEYKKISIMKDRAKATENGLIFHTEKELFCIKCHNAESPTFTGFFYETYWEKIKHPKPVKE
ncbi:MAG: cytochrome C554 [Ignavibacteria bacterium]|nr:cytochrome C554 [Ignavibacteria bacterium]